MHIVRAEATPSTFHARIAAPALAMLCALAIAQPQAAHAHDGLQAQVGIEAWPALDVRPSSERSARLDAARTSEIDTRLWIGRGSTALGIGTIMSDAPLAGPFSAHSAGLRAGGTESSMVVGLRYQLANGSRLTLGASAWPFAKSDSAAAEPDVRLALDLKPSRDRKRFSRGTIFRAQLGEGTQLSLRVRSGGLRLVLRSEF